MAVRAARNALSRAGVPAGDLAAVLHAWTYHQGHDFWSPALPDLRTRLAVTPTTRIGHPDDSLFAALIQLFFADRGLHIPADALRFMAERLHRDYWTAERAVEAVDRFAIAERARLSLPTIRRALAEAKMIGEAA